MKSLLSILAPVDGGDLPKYEAGQYISVRVFVEELGLNNLANIPLQPALKLTIYVSRSNVKMKKVIWQAVGCQIPCMV